MNRFILSLFFLGLVSCTNAIPEITHLSPIRAPEAVAIEKEHHWHVQGKCSYTLSYIMFSTDGGQRWFTLDGLGEDTDCGENRTFEFSVSKGSSSLLLKEIAGNWDSFVSSLVLIESLTLDDETIIYPTVPSPTPPPVSPDPTPVPPETSTPPTTPSQPTDFVKGHEKVRTSGGITITSVDELRDFFVIKLTVSGMTQYRYYFSPYACNVSEEYAMAGTFYDSGTNLVVEKTEVMPNLCISGYTILFSTPLKFGSFLWSDLLE